ncbi:MAG: DUF6036 family nucleotidyltransferase [Methanobacteriota archaeon]
MRDVEETALAFDRAARRARVDYAYVGGVAVMAWGQPRATSDVDALVALASDQIPDFVEALRAEGLTAAATDFESARVDRSHVTVFDDHSAFHVDVKLARDPSETAQVREALDVKFGDGVLRVARPEDTVAFKLSYGSPQDIQDVRSILVRQRGRLDVDRLREFARRLKVSKDLERAMRDAEER